MRISLSTASLGNYLKDKSPKQYSLSLLGEILFQSTEEKEEVLANCDLKRNSDLVSSYYANVGLPEIPEPYISPRNMRRLERKKFYKAGKGTMLYRNYDEIDKVFDDVGCEVKCCESVKLTNNSSDQEKQNISTITLRPSSESAKTYNETEISYAASCILDDAMAEYSATQILNRVVNDTKATTELMIGGQRLFDKITCERFESELKADFLYLFNEIVVTERFSATGNLAMQAVELYACAIELVDDIKENNKQKIPLPARTLLCSIFNKIIAETKPSNGAGYGDRQVKIYNEEIGDETRVAKNLKVLIGISAYIILHHAGVEKYQKYADDLSEFCRGLNQNLSDSILGMSTKGCLAADNVIEEMKRASRNYVEGNRYLSHYLLTGGKEAVDAEILSDDEAKKLSPEFVDLAFSPLREARCNEGWPVIDKEKFNMVVQNFRNWYNKMCTLSIKKFKIKGTNEQLYNVFKAVRSNIVGKKEHKLRQKDYEVFLRLQFSNFDKRKSSFSNKL